MPINHPNNDHLTIHQQQLGDRLYPKVLSREVYLDNPSFVFCRHREEEAIIFCKFSHTLNYISHV